MGRPEFQNPARAPLFFFFGSILLSSLPVSVLNPGQIEFMVIVQSSMDDLPDVVSGVESIYCALLVQSSLRSMLIMDDARKGVM